MNESRVYYTHRLHRRKAKPDPWRFTVLAAVIMASALGLSYRLAVFQVAEHSQLAQAASDSTYSASPPQNRGLIYDDVGNPLALDDQVEYVIAAPNQIPDPRDEAGILARAFHLKRKPLVRVLRSKLGWAKIAGPFAQSREQALNRVIQKGHLVGISLQAFPNRVYPEGTLAAQLLGFVDQNGGQYGLEQRYDRLLAGKAPASRLDKMAAREGGVLRTDPANTADTALDNGATLHLSVDTFMQDIVEQDLKQAVVSSGGSGGTAIVMNPVNGRIIALASYPTFNPNMPTASPPGNWVDPAISYTYEPGSTFKVITMSAGINTGVITPKTTINDPGYHAYPAAGIVVHNWNFPVSNGWETMIQVLQHSANVGAAHVAQLLGVNRFYPYVKAFGVGRLSGVDLQGEVRGSLPLPGNPLWSLSNLYTNSYGQSLTLTPLQLLNAVDAVAHRGLLMRPEVVGSIDYRGRSLHLKPHVIRRVMSAKSAHTVTHMLVKSAVGGEASLALVPGYRIAAKTGTATIPGLSGTGSTIASTVGYAPANHPRFSVLVVVRQPRTMPWGSMIAAPVVHDIFQSLFLHYHIKPSSTQTQ